MRQFLRASNDYEAVGSGGRYTFEADELPTMKTRFDAWLAQREAAAKARAEQAANQTAAKSDDGDKAEDQSAKPARP